MPEDVSGRGTKFRVSKVWNLQPSQMFYKSSVLGTGNYHPVNEILGPMCLHGIKAGPLDEKTRLPVKAKGISTKYILVQQRGPASQHNEDPQKEVNPDKSGKQLHGAQRFSQ